MARIPREELPVDDSSKDAVGALRERPRGWLLSRRGWIALAKIGLAVGLIAWLISQHVLGENKIPFEKLGQLATTWPLAVLSVALYGLVMLAAAARWQLFLRSQGITYRFAETFELTLIGMFFNQVLLGSTGGDVVKAYYVARESPGKRTAAALTVFVDRALGLLVVVFIACGAAVTQLDLVRSSVDLSSLVVVIAMIAAVSLVGSVLFYAGLFEREGIRRWLARLPGQTLIRRGLEILEAYRGTRRDLGKIILLSVAVQGLVILTNLALLGALEPVLPGCWPFLLLVPVAQIVLAIPLTPAGLGTGEWAYERLFSLVGVNSGLLVSLLLRGVNYVWAAVGAVLYIRRRSRIRRAQRATPQPDAEVLAVAERAAERTP